MIYRNRPRLRGDQPQYEASARIVSQTAEDGSPLDSGAELDRCAPGEDCLSIPMSSADRAAAANRAIAQAMARDGAAEGSNSGGNGSGGIYPFDGGLPGSFPAPLKALLVTVLLAGAAVVTLNQLAGRKRR